MWPRSPIQRGRERALWFRRRAQIQAEQHGGRGLAQRTHGDGQPAPAILVGELLRNQVRTLAPQGVVPPEATLLLRRKAVLRHAAEATFFRPKRHPPPFFCAALAQGVCRREGYVRCLRTTRAMPHFGLLGRILLRCIMSFCDSNLHTN